MFLYVGFTVLFSPFTIIVLVLKIYMLPFSCTCVVVREYRWSLYEHMRCFCLALWFHFSVQTLYAFRMMGGVVASLFKRKYELMVIKFCLFLFSLQKKKVIYENNSYIRITYGKKSVYKCGVGNLFMEFFSYIIYLRNNPYVMS